MALLKYTISQLRIQSFLFVCLTDIDIPDLDPNSFPTLICPVMRPQDFSLDLVNLISKMTVNTQASYKSEDAEMLSYLANQM